VGAGLVCYGVVTGVLLSGVGAGVFCSGVYTRVLFAGGSSGVVVLPLHAAKVSNTRIARVTVSSIFILNPPNYISFKVEFF